MSALAVLLFAGVTALTAAIVAVLTAAMAAGTVNRSRRPERSRHPEGPVPGHQTPSSGSAEAGESGPPDGAPGAREQAWSQPDAAAEPWTEADQGLPAADPASDAAAADLNKLLEELDMAAAAVDADLLSIDGGGLPAPAPTAPQQAGR